MPRLDPFFLQRINGQYKAVPFGQATSLEDKEVPQVYDKDIKDIRGSLRLEAVFDPMMVVMIAVHKDEARNHKVRIPCTGTLPMKGYTYCAINDCCTVNCCDSVILGMISVSYVAHMRGSAGWRLPVPMPEKVIKRYLSLDQRRKLRAFQDKFKESPGDVSFEYVQMISAH